MIGLMHAVPPEKPVYSPFHENLLEVRIPRKDFRYGVWFRNFPRLKDELNLIHRHRELEILYCPDDYGVYFINDHQYDIEPGDVFIVNGNEFHQPILKKPCSSGARVIYFDPAFIGSEVVNQPWRNAFLFASRLRLHKLGNNRQLHTLFSEFQTAFESDSMGWVHLCRGILSHILALIGDEFLKQTTDVSGDRFSPDILEFGAVIEHIMRHLEGPIQAELLYRLAGLSKSQFSQKFRRTFGVSASQYIQRERVNRSMALLLSSTLTVTEISLACGFNWLGYFNRAFKAQAGMSPSQYRLTLQRPNRDAR